MARKTPPPYTTFPEIEIPQDPQPVNGDLERHVAARWSGLYLLMVVEESPQGSLSVLELSLAGIDSPSAEPQCSQTTVCALIMSACFSHAERKGERTKFMVRLHQRTEDPKNPFRVRVRFSLLPAVVGSSLSVVDEKPPSEETHIALNEMIRTTTMGVNMVLDRALQFADRCAARSESASDRYEGLVHSFVQDRESHSRIAQAGFDALNEGVGMQGRVLQDRWNYEMKLRQAQDELEGARASKVPISDGFMKMMTPLFTLAGAQAMTKFGLLPPGSDKEIYGAIASSISGSTEGDNGLPPPTPPGETVITKPEPAPPATVIHQKAPVFVISDVANDEAMEKQPFRSLFRLLHKTISANDQDAIRSCMKPDEWNAFCSCFGLSEDEIVRCLSKLLADLGTQRAPALLESFSPRTRSLFQALLVQCKRFIENKPFAWARCVTDAESLDHEVHEDEKATVKEDLVDPPVTTIACPKCSQEWPTAMVFCGACGTEIRAVERFEAKPRARPKGPKKKEISGTKTTAERKKTHTITTEA
jgi:hypothetical protein